MDETFKPISMKNFVSNDAYTNERQSSTNFNIGEDLSNNLNVENIIPNYIGNNDTDGNFMKLPQQRISVNLNKPDIDKDYNKLKIIKHKSIDDSSVLKQLKNNFNELLQNLMKSQSNSTKLVRAVTMFKALKTAQVNVVSDILTSLTDYKQKQDEAKEESKAYIRENIVEHQMPDTSQKEIAQDENSDDTSDDVDMEDSPDDEKIVTDKTLNNVKTVLGNKNKFVKSLTNVIKNGKNILPLAAVGVGAMSLFVPKNSQARENIPSKKETSQILQTQNKREQPNQKVSQKNDINEKVLGEYITPFVKNIVGIVEENDKLQKKSMEDLSKTYLRFFEYVDAKIIPSFNKKVEDYTSNESGSETNTENESGSETNTENISVPKNIEDIKFGDVKSFGKYIKANFKGWRVSENSAFGGVSNVHGKNSAHYRDNAIDVNYKTGVIEANDPKTYQTMRQIIEIARVRGLVGIDEKNHLHVQPQSDTGGLKIPSQSQFDGKILPVYSQAQINEKLNSAKNHVTNIDNEEEINVIYTEKGGSKPPPSKSSSNPTKSRVEAKR